MIKTCNKKLISLLFLVTLKLIDEGTITIDRVS